MTYRSRSAGITLLSLFFAFGALASGLTAVMLSFPGSVLEPLWRLNPRAHEGLAMVGWWAVPLMTAVCMACAAAALGMWLRTRWGFWTALAILAINLTGDTANALIARDYRSLIGLPVGGVMIAYLLRERHVFVS